MSESFRSNEPGVWLSAFPKLKDTINKYDRGHAVILGAAELLGATRLSTSACSRIGAGMVTVLSNISTQAYRIALPADIMVKECCVEDLKHVTAVLGGPGGISRGYMDMLLECRPEIKRVFDAAALTDDLRARKLGPNTVLTPHDGEFNLVFGQLSGDRISQSLQAARNAECVVIRKGPTTIISHPDGRYAVNNAPNPFLAKAGTGDVLAGIVTGLLAQSMPVFEAACAAVWIHSEAGDKLGHGLRSRIQIP